jgi:hypothetical protein
MHNCMQGMRYYVALYVVSHACSLCTSNRFCRFIPSSLLRARLSVSFPCFRVALVSFRRPSVCSLSERPSPSCKSPAAKASSTPRCAYATSLPCLSLLALACWCVALLFFFASRLVLALVLARQPCAAFAASSMLTRAADTLVKLEPKVVMKFVVPLSTP